MLPFLKKSMEASVSAPVDSVKREPDEETPFDSMEVAAEDILSAVHSKDAKALATALRATFELMDSEPHFEGEHE